jgi:uncharacterized protein (TIGR02001 family)
MMKKTLLTAAVATSLMSGAAITQAESAWSTSANVALTSEYRFRGISQSNENPALQGGFDVGHESGFYFGTWGSTVDFDFSESDGGYNGSLELDYYAGYGADINDDWSWDIGYMYYDYPGDEGDEGDYQEIYGSIAWKDLTVGFAASDDYYAETDEFYYIYADYSFALPNEFALDLHVGLNNLEEDGGFLSSDEDQYVDYSVSISRDFAGLNFGISYIGTDLDDDDVFGTDWADDVVTATISAEF